MNSSDTPHRSSSVNRARVTVKAKDSLAITRPDRVSKP